MTEKITNYQKTQDSNTTIFQFENSRDVLSVQISLEEDFAQFKGCQIKVEYAINGVTTDLMFLADLKICDSNVLELKNSAPISATHFYITLSKTEIPVKEIAFFEEKKDNEKNCYPMYFDTDLGENYYLDTISVFTCQEGYSQYSVYTSLNGRDFDLLAIKRNSAPCCFETGDIHSANGKEARIIRVYIEYNSTSANALFDRVEFTGEKSRTPILTRPKIEIADFKDSEYNIEINDCDTYNELYGIIARRLGEEYKDWFVFELAKNPKGNNCDYFELSDSAEKLIIKGNNGVSLAVGLNHYLKYYCKVNISQVGGNTAMPSKKVNLNASVFKETKARVRYAYNYCTLSYSMAFWGEKEWRDELDWLALNGVNVVLDATAQEEVWRRFLTSIGYTHEEILKYITGPAYYAWAYMANMSGFGGPVHDSWFAERTNLARKNHLIMRKLGMYPVLQGYSGMVPNDICEHCPQADIIHQGTWGSFDRPEMLRTTMPVFREFAEKFYKAQKEVYGEYSIYFATDPFHEGGNMGNMCARDISREVLGAMLKSNPNSIWIIQSWQQNPTSGLLAGIELVENGKHHALILDLYAEKDPNYKKGHSDNPNHGYSKEFASTPWVFCMLNNFGGRLGLHGHLDNMARWIPEAFNSCKSIAGIGITPEASFNNPVLYDFLFESIWQSNTEEKIQEINLKEWIIDYAERRYGAKSISAVKAWEILIETVYKAQLNNIGQGAPESVVNALPSLKSGPASTWGNIIIGYDKALLRKAAALLLEDYELLKNSEGYKYDVITILQQVLSNTAQDVHLEMISTFENKDIEAFKEKSQEFLHIADLMDTVTSGSEYYLLGRWVGQAKRLAQNADDFSKMLYMLNAKSLITTWGSYNQCQVGRLRDYSNRQWSGLISDFYKPRWERWITNRINELNGEDFEEGIVWFVWEWEWVRRDTEYPELPQEIDLLNTSKEIL